VSSWSLPPRAGFSFVTLDNLADVFPFCGAKFVGALFISSLGTFELIPPPTR